MKDKRIEAIADIIGSEKAAEEYKKKEKKAIHGVKWLFSWKRVWAPQLTILTIKAKAFDAIVSFLEERGENWWEK